MTQLIRPFCLVLLSLLPTLAFAQTAPPNQPPPTITIDPNCLVCRQLRGREICDAVEHLTEMEIRDLRNFLLSLPSNDRLATISYVVRFMRMSNRTITVEVEHSMQLRVTRPGFLTGIAALAASAEPVPHLPSIEKWRKGSRSPAYDPNQLATRQEMRSFVCGQCHVEYYCGPNTTLFFPWNKGLKVEQIEAYYDSYKFPDGHRFYDWKHADTGTEILKAQHPEFETWSQGIHARSGVACADCHMPYKREGAIKISDHWVRSPLLNVANACQTCHRFPEEEILARVEIIQDRNHALLIRAEDATVSLINAIAAAIKAGATDEQLAPARELHRKAQWRVDFVSAENSMGFHAPQETARILAEAIDYARQGELAVTKLALPVAAAAK